MRKLSCAIAVAMLLLPFLVFANGDPVATYSALTLSRTPVAVHIPEVQLVSENVSFRPCGLYTEVNVKYVLVNNSSKDFKKISYGFPIDYNGEGPARMHVCDIYSESEAEIGWRDSYVKDVSFVLNGQKLQWQCSKDTMLVPSKRELNEFDMQIYYPENYEKFFEDTSMWADLYAKHGDSVFWYSDPIMRRWYYTTLSIGPQAKVELQVSYRVEHNLSMPMSSLISMIDKSYKDSHECRFEYDFSPASYWGNGQADNFHIKFDASKINLLYCDGEISVNDEEMKHNGDIFTYDATNFKLAEVEPFYVNFSMKPDQMQRPLDRIAEKTIPTSDYTVTVSGVDEKYPVSNMFDDNLATTAVLRPGKNDTVTITIHFKDSVELGGFLLYNGYCKSPDAWRNNSRIKQCVPFVYWKEFDQMMELFEIEETLVNPPKVFDRQALTDEALLCAWRGPSYVTEFTIVVKEITPGIKYNDLCVSELILLRK